MMTRKRKNLFILTSISLLIIGTFLFILFRPSQLNQTSITKPNEDTVDEVIEQVGRMDEAMQSPVNELQQNLQDAVDQTLSVFTQNDYQITAIGDSLTQGVGDETNSDGYLTTLKTRLTNLDYRVRIENYGRRGNRTDQLIKRIEEENAIQRSIRRADLVLITVGANDILRIARDNILNLEEDLFDLEIDHYEERLIDLFELIHSYNNDAQIYLVGFYNPFEGYFDEIEAFQAILAAWNDTGRAVFESRPNGHFIPIHDLFQIDAINLLADDNFHPNQTGYSLIASRVLHSIVPMLERIEYNSEVVFNKEREGR